MKVADLNDRTHLKKTYDVKRKRFSFLRWLINALHSNETVM